MKGLRYIIGAAALAAMASCALDEPAFEPIEGEEGLKPIVIAGKIDQEYATRANDEGFCNGDVVGIYVVDYDGDTPGTLQNEGNRDDNVRFTFDEAAYKWNPAYEIYWKDKNTNIMATAGVLAGPAAWLDLYAGAGYGQKTLLWQDIDGSWAAVSDFTHKGMALEIGLITSWRPLSLGLGISTINFRTASLDLSVGVRF